MTVCGPINACIVDDHQVAIERAAYVQFYKVSIKDDRLFNRLNCVLGCMPRCATMSDAYHLNCPSVVWLRGSEKGAGLSQKIFESEVCRQIHEQRHDQHHQREVQHRR